MMTNRTIRALALGAVALAMVAGPAEGQWVRQNEQFYLPAEHNWVFRKYYPQADRLFNAFDYGHAILYEELWRHPDAGPERLEQKEFDFITQELLNNPPRVPLVEGAIEIAYARLAPEAKLMFHWAHILHRQIYDVLADERLSEAQKDAAVTEIMRYYRSRPDLAFSARPKTMELMEGHYYSTAFREEYPKFNGLIWAYHWLQVGLYEPLLVGQTQAERNTGVTAAVARFRQMLEDAPTNMPRIMPMTAAVAPRFAERYPEAAIVFDNLHSMHDVISDILASEKVPRDRKRAEILLAAERFRDDTSYVMTPDEWRRMSVGMGIENQGGPAVGFLPGFPTPTVERGAVMAGMDHAAHGAPSPTAADPHAGHGQPSAAPHGQMQHGQHQHGAAGEGGMQCQMMQGEGMQHGQGHQCRMENCPMHQRMHGDSAGGHGGHGAGHGGMPPEHMRMMHEMHARMLSDSVIHRRMMADTAMHRMMMQMMEHLPAEERARMMEKMHGAGHGAGHTHGERAAPADGARPRRPAAAPRRSTTPARPATPRTTAPRPRPQANPHQGHGGHRHPPAPARPDTSTHRHP